MNQEDNQTQQPEQSVVDPKVDLSLPPHDPRREARQAAADRIQAALSRTSPGPWKCLAGPGFTLFDGNDVDLVHGADDRSVDNASFAVEARNGVGLLIELLQQQQRRIEKLEEGLAGIIDASYTMHSREAKSGSWMNTCLFTHVLMPGIKLMPYHEETLIKLPDDVTLAAASITIGGD